jgi:hypothetical protein
LSGLREGGGRRVAVEGQITKGNDEGRGRLYGRGVQRRIYRCVSDLPKKRKSIKIIEKALVFLWKQVLLVVIKKNYAIAI